LTARQRPTYCPTAPDPFPDGDPLDNVAASSASQHRCAPHLLNGRERLPEIEPESGAVVQAFTTGTVVQVFLLAGSTSTETWTEKENGDLS